MSEPIRVGGRLPSICTECLAQRDASGFMPHRATCSQDPSRFLADPHPSSSGVPSEPIHKHRCMRCDEEFACRYPGVCVAKYDVLPTIPRVEDGRVVGFDDHCTLGADGKWYPAPAFVTLDDDPQYELGDVATCPMCGMMLGNSVTWCEGDETPHVRWYRPDYVRALRVAASRSSRVAGTPEDLLRRVIADYDSSIASCDSLGSPLLLREAARRRGIRDELRALLDRTVKPDLRVGTPEALSETVALMREVASELRYAASHVPWNPTPEVIKYCRALCVKLDDASVRLAACSRETETSETRLVGDPLRPRVNGAVVTPVHDAQCPAITRSHEQGDNCTCGGMQAAARAAGYKGYLAAARHTSAPSETDRSRDAAEVPAARPVGGE